MRYLRPSHPVVFSAVRERPEVVYATGRRPRNPKAVGELSEAAVVHHLIRAGYDLAKPLGDNARYDLIIDDGDRFLRVQIKTGRLVEGVIRFEASSSQAHRGRGRQSYRGQIELFAVYSPDLDKTYLVPVDECGAIGGTLRLEPPRNSQRAGVRWAAQYEVRPNAG